MMAATLFDILYAPLFEQVFEKREIVDVDYIDVTDEVQQDQSEEAELLGYGEDNPRPNQ
ncbi:MAG: hypothetical protein NC453_16710 [Muribaculum sp.]|nr:hypothetical protein [Muribaculum sp.]